MGIHPDFETSEGIKRTLFYFFVIPFINGHQYDLFAPAWFLIQPYVVTVVFCLSHPVDRPTGSIWIYVLLFGVTTLLLSKWHDNIGGLQLILTRTSFGLLFYHSGFLIKSNIEKIKHLIFSEKSIIAYLTILNAIFLSLKNRDLSYSIVWGNIGNNLPVIPLTTTTLIILITLWLANAISKAIPETPIISSISNHTFHIMVFHLSIFFFINFILYRIWYIEKSSLSDAYFAYKPEKNWILYEVSAIYFSVLIGKTINRIKRASGGS